MGSFKLSYLLGFVRFSSVKLMLLNKLVTNGCKYYFGNHIKMNVNKNSQIILDNKVYISDYCYFECKDAPISIGYNNFFNDRCRLVALKEIEIGENNLFGPNVGIYDHDHCYLSKDNLINKQGFSTKKVKIGSNVWIGANVIITKGVTIGDRVVVGANSVVTKDLPANGLYAGNPIKLIKAI